MTNKIVIKRGQAGLRLTRTEQLLVRRCVDETLVRTLFFLPSQADVLYTSNERIRAINSSERGKDEVTDVLSFPAIDWAAGGQPEFDPDSGRVFLGDIVLSLERTYEQAEENENTFMRELGYLTTHAVLHLLGYDHTGEKDTRIMRAKEEEVLSAIGLPR